MTKCCKCGTPTAYTTDYKGRHYCKKHSRNKPKNPNPDKWELMHSMDNRLPRKYKKLLKNCAKKSFEKSNIHGKIKFSYKVFIKFTCEDHELCLLFKRHEKDLIKKYK